MKVLVFVKHPVGGIKTYCAYMYGNSAMSDVEFTLLTPSTESSSYFRDKLGKKIVHVQANNGNFALLVMLCKLLLKDRPDLVHSHGFTAGILAAIPAKLFGVSHVITVHDILQASQFKGWRGRLRRWLVGCFLSLADCINPVGEDAKNNLKEFYQSLLNRPRIFCIRNGIDSRFFLSDSRRDLKSEVGLDKQIILAGFFGRFMAQKGFRVLVDLVEQWNQGKQVRALHVACFGWGDFIREEKRDLKSRNLSQYFHFFDNTDDMPAALRGVDVVTMPSRWEACPLLAMEALTAGVPLIVSDCIGNREVAKDSPALVFKSEDVSDFKGKMKMFVKEEGVFKERAENFRATAAVRFDVDIAAAKLRELYDDL